MGWAEYALAGFAFFATHSIPLRPPVKAKLVGLFGARGFTILYSALSLGVLYWVILAAGRAPFLPLWDWEPWQLHVPQIAMALVCLIVALSIGRPNPFSFGGGRNAAFDPRHPGLVRWIRHPMLLALGLWAAAHVVPNGDLAHVLLFGIFAAFALLGMALIDRRKRREMGARWAELRSQVAASPAIPRVTDPTGVAWRAAIAALVYGLLVWAHPYVIGVPAFG